MTAGHRWACTLLHSCGSQLHLTLYLFGNITWNGHSYLRSTAAMPGRRCEELRSFSCPWYFLRSEEEEKKTKKQWQLITIKGMSLLHLAPDLSLALRRFRPATPSLERDTNERIGTKHLTKCSWMPSAPQPYLSSLWSLIPWNHHLCIRVSR